MHNKIAQRASGFHVCGVCFGISNLGEHESACRSLRISTLLGSDLSDFHFWELPRIAWIVGGSSHAARQTFDFQIMHVPWHGVLGLDVCELLTYLG